MLSKSQAFVSLFLVQAKFFGNCAMQEYIITSSDAEKRGVILWK